MKKILLMLVMLCATLTSFAQINWYKTTAYAQAKVYNGQYYWGEWEASSLKICMNLNTDVITIYSPKIQTYNVVADGYTYYDNEGGSNLAFSVVDQDADRGTVRLRIDKSGTSQLYVDFNNVAWVYNVVKLY